MDITYENVNQNRVHTTQGPKVRFDLVNNGTAGVRAILTVDDDISINFPSEDGGSVTVTRTLTKIGVVHPAAVVIAAEAAPGRRDYDFSIAINGKVVVRCKGSVPNNQTTEMKVGPFQLRVN